MPRADLVTIWEGQNVISSARLAFANGALVVQADVPNILLTVHDKMSGDEVPIPMLNRRPGSASAILTQPSATPPVLSDSITIGATVYTIETAGSFAPGGITDVLIGATPFDTYQHLKAAINGTRYKGRGEGEIYGRALVFPHANVEAQLAVGIIDTTLAVKLEIGRRDDMGPSGDALATLDPVGTWTWDGATIGAVNGGTDTITGLITDGFWKRDSLGYNWQDKFPGDAILEQGGRIFRLEYEFTTLLDGPLFVVAEADTAARFGA